MSVCSANPAPRVTVADYVRAERFLHWNKDLYVINADIQHHWIGTEDRFWYLRTDPAGGKQFVVVDAASGKVTPAFDQKRIADILSKASGHRVEAGGLPFSSFQYAQNGTAIEFRVARDIWTCQLRTAKCSVMPESVTTPEVVSPDGRWAAFLKDHNVWVRSTSSESAFALTDDGIEHYAYATAPGYGGHTVTDKRHARPARPQVSWSPDSRYLLSLRLDERKVRDSWLVQSIPEDGSVRPMLYAYRYAMPGDEFIPLQEPIVFDVAARRRVDLDTPPLICSALTLIQKHDTWWAADGKTVYYLNRDRFSKWVNFYRADPVTGAVSSILREDGDPVVHMSANSFLDFPTIRTLRNGDFIWYSQRDGWGHLYYYDMRGTLRNQITQGDWVVRGIVRVDEPKKKIYFMASGREGGRDPYEQYLYSVQFDGSQVTLLTLDEAEHKSFGLSLLSLEGGLASEAEVAQTAAFSASGRYFVDSYSRPDTPPMFAVRAADGRLIKRVEQADISKLKKGGYVPIEPFQVTAADGVTPIYGNLFRPSTFDPSRKYPLIDSIYPGPQSIRTAKSFVAAMFDGFEAQSLAELGFIVITIDGRGTPNRSKRFLNYSYGKLGKASELEDHVAGIRELARRYPYLDLSRVGVDGVSAGAYAAVHAMLAYPDIFKVGVAAQGNYEQRAYASYWGENYMGPLRESDYEAASSLSLASNLKGKLFLMHGEMDDNVSPAHTMKLVGALIKANKDFDLLLMPNADHDAFLTSRYYIRRKWDYFARHLLDAHPPAQYSIQ